MLCGRLHRNKNVAAIRKFPKHSRFLIDFRSPVLICFVQESNLNAVIEAVERDNISTIVSVTPAMQAGLIRKFMKLEDTMMLTDIQAPKTRGSNKKNEAE